MDEIQSNEQTNKLSCKKTEADHESVTFPYRDNENNIHLRNIWIFHRTVQQIKPRCCKVHGIQLLEKLLIFSLMKYIIFSSSFLSKKAIRVSFFVVGRGMVQNVEFRLQTSATDEHIWYSNMQISSTSVKLVRDIFICFSPAQHFHFLIEMNNLLCYNHHLNHKWPEVWSSQWRSSGRPKCTVRCPLWTRRPPQRDSRQEAASDPYAGFPRVS